LRRDQPDPDKPDPDRPNPLACPNPLVQNRAAMQLGSIGPPA